MKNALKWFVLALMVLVAEASTTPPLSFVRGEGAALDVKASGVAISRSGSISTWTARPANEGDFDFLKGLFGDIRVMEHFGDGTVRDKEHVVSRLQAAKERFGGGSPHGSMILSDSANNPIGWFIAGGGDGAGVSEVALALAFDVWGRGYGKSLVQFLVKIWAPDVRAKGEKPENSQFRCFGGKALERLDATTSPNNIYMQRILDASGFQAAKTRAKELDSVKLDAEGTLQEQLAALYKGDNPLQKGERYIASFGGKQITFSWSRFNCIKLHYEHNVPAGDPAPLVTN